jgi:hypothetical protein
MVTIAPAITSQDIFTNGLGALLMGERLIHRVTRARSSQGVFTNGLGVLPIGEKLIYKVTHITLNLDNQAGANKNAWRRNRRQAQTSGKHITPISSQ